MKYNSENKAKINLPLTENNIYIRIKGKYIAY